MKGACTSRRFARIYLYAQNLSDVDNPYYRVRRAPVYISPIFSFAKQPTQSLVCPLHPVIAYYGLLAIQQLS